LLILFRNEKHVEEINLTFLLSELTKSTGRRYKHFVVMTREKTGEKIKSTLALLPLNGGLSRGEEAFRFWAV